ncbi:hypothetical protein VOLCADRAFT_108307 [Volvox carteri f. nagariensis]|uniref:Uncharacterized protein n=1 Tax=Volvox carteri f. nagariensis TaxID=3068 RepID=D8UJD6_VOLCA|nr:uncharacterized protein VOLCADRAFT_108307 [Volvox carteri f. nagariensis]EFJ40155.1 hypothetical protein VOLCADRAFT_108307 [Volvox carteri f. nagariensis]|eukprot:XP_002958765.1 hypothetical protein VOLCADRAFT_108307 [Volvox carteri f. nagariensis]
MTSDNHTVRNALDTRDKWASAKRCLKTVAPKPCGADSDTRKLAEVAIATAADKSDRALLVSSPWLKLGTVNTAGREAGEAAPGARAAAAAGVRAAAPTRGLRAVQHVVVDTEDTNNGACTFQCTTSTVANRVFSIYYNVLDGPKPPRGRRRSNTSGGSAASSGGSGASAGRGSTGSGSHKRALDTDEDEEDTATAATGNALDYKDWQIPLGRRFSTSGLICPQINGVIDSSIVSLTTTLSLKLYFVLRMYGAEKLRSYLRHHIAMAQVFAAEVTSDPRFELAAPQRFGLVCFRLRDVPREVNEALLDEINSSGRMFLIHTELGGRFTLRLAVGSATTQLEHVEAAWREVREAADRVLLRWGQAKAMVVRGKVIAARGSGVEERGQLEKGRGKGGTASPGTTADLWGPT